MRPLRTWALGLLAACSTGPVPDGPRERPQVALVRGLPAGTRLGTELLPGLPDEPWARAAEVWWREALRQSVAFEIADERPGRDAVVLSLGIDPEGRRLSAFLREPSGARAPLAGEAFADGDLAAGIDRIAWAARLALGEDAEPPLAVAAVVSAEPRAVDAAHDAHALLHDGGVEAARRAFLAARRLDGGSPWVLDGLAAVLLLRGDAVEAERVCLEALGYERRLSATVRHGLARTLLMARASQQPDRAPDRDRELLALGQAGRRERPHDPECVLTVAIADNMLADFAAARPLLEGLRTRLPRSAIVDYHLGWACLGTGDPGAALTAFTAAAVRLPPTWVVLPRAIAHFDAGDHDGLDRMLAGLLDDLGPRDFGLVHEVHRMRAAHAILRGDRAAAAEHMIADFHWLVANPTLLDQRPGQFAEQGEVLVRLGRGDALLPVLAAAQGQRPGSAVADACAFLSGLVEVATRHERTRELEDRLGRGGDNAWALRLQAFAHELRGELADMHAALARAARLSDSPLTKTMLAHSLAAMGREPEAEALRAALRRELTTVHLRRRPSHPLLGPELAFAYRAE